MADENHRATSAPPVYSTTEGLSSILSHCIQSHPWLYEQTNLWKRVHHCDYYAFAVAEIRHCQDNRIDYLTLVFRSLKTSWTFSVASSVEGSFWSYLDTDFSTLRFFPDAASNRGIRKSDHSQICWRNRDAALRKLEVSYCEPVAMKTFTNVNTMIRIFYEHWSIFYVLRFPSISSSRP